MLVSGAQILWSKLHAKVSAAKSSLSDTSHVQSRDVLIHESYRYTVLEKRKIFSSTLKNLWKTQRGFGNDRMRAWKVRPFFRQFIPIRLLKSFHWPFTDGRVFLIQSYTFWNWRRPKPALLSVLFSELSLNYLSFLLTITKKETEQETNHSSSIESPRFLPFSFEELQNRSLLRRNCTDDEKTKLCGPLV